MTPHVQDGLTKTMTNVQNFAGQFNLTKSGFDPNMPGHSTEHDMVFRQ